MDFLLLLIAAERLWKSKLKMKFSIVCLVLPLFSPLVTSGKSTQGWLHNKMWCNISCTTMNRLIFHPWKYGPYCSCSMQDVWSLSSWISTGPGDGTVQPEVLRGGNNSSYGRILGWETLALAARRGDRRKEGERKGKSHNPICRSDPAMLV